MRSRERIIAATLELIERGGFAAVNIAAVAAGAGVSRQTVYAVFGSREQLVSEAVQSVLLETLSKLDAVKANATTALDFVIELIVVGRTELRRQPVFIQLLRGDSDGNPLFDDDMMARAHPVAAFLFAPMTELEPRLAARFDDIVEFIIRIALSVLLTDSERIEGDDGLRAFLRTWMEPALRELSS